MRIRSSWGGSPNIRAVQGAVSNARGRDFEDYLDRACQLYRNNGIANIEKTPEPFKCLKKNKENERWKNYQKGLWGVCTHLQS